MEVKILHLFYDLMNLYGEYGNLNILKSRLEDQGITVTLDKKSVYDEIDFLEYDFLYCGSGTEKNEAVALEYLLNHKEQFQKYIESNKYALFTGNSIELLCNKLVEDDQEKDLLGLNDYIVTRTKDRITGDVILKSEQFENKIIGFINKQANISGIENAISNVVFGIGADEKNTIEGFKINNLFASYVIGPILVKNPELLEFFVRNVINQKYPDHSYKAIEYPNELEGYKLVLEELSQRIK